MSGLFGLGKSNPVEGEDKTFLWLILGLLLLMVAMGVLAFLVLRSAGETGNLLVSLGLTTPTPARPVTSPVAPTAGATPATPVRPITLTATVPAPPPVAAWYFAEGSSAAPFHTSYVLVNPGEAALQGKVTLLPESSASTEVSFTVKGQSRLTLPAEKLLPNASFAARFQANAPFYVERTVTFGHDAHSATGVLPAKTWYLPIVSTLSGYDDWLLLANFNPTSAKATVNFLAQGGISQTLTYTVPAMSRVSLMASKVLAPFSKIQPGVPLGAVVESDQPIVVEQSTYFDQAGAGYASGGSPVLAKNWYLAEGNTRPDFDTLLAILNPGNSVAKLTVTFWPEGQAKITKSYAVNPASFLQVKLNAEISGVALATMIEADQPVAVERVMTFNQGTAAHASLGATAAAKEWFLPEASTASPSVPVLVILNPGAVAADVTVTLYRENGRPTEKTLTVAAASRLALLLEQIVPNALLSARVRASQPVVVERVTYFRNAKGGMASMGIPTQQ